MVRKISAYIHFDCLTVVKRFLVIALAVSIGVAQLHASPPKTKKQDDRHKIFALEDAWRNAVLKNDTTTLGSLLADDYMAITATGMLQTKQEALANLSAHRVHITTLLLSDRKVRFYGKTALVTSLAEVLGSNAEGDISGSFRYSRVYVRDAQGKWKIVNFESSRIHQPFEHHKQDSAQNEQ